MILETDRLLLKSSSCEFAEPLAQFYIHNKDFLEQFEPKREPSFFTVEEQLANLQSELALQDSKTLFRFYLFDKQAPDTIIGVVALSNIVWGGFLSAFLGYKLSEDCLHRGYMTEAVGRVVRFAFDELGLHRIEGNVMPRNTPSLAVLRRCGFVHEGDSPSYLRINGVWEDHMHMVLLNQDI